MQTSTTPITIDETVRQAILSTHAMVLKKGPRDLEQYACWMEDLGIPTHLRQDFKGVSSARAGDYAPPMCRRA